MTVHFVYIPPFFAEDLDVVVWCVNCVIFFFLYLKIEDILPEALYFLIFCKKKEQQKEKKKKKKQQHLNKTVFPLSKPNNHGTAWNGTKTILGNTTQLCRTVLSMSAICYV